MAALRYLVKDITRSIAFYTEHLGFKMTHQLDQKIRHYGRSTRPTRLVIYYG
jgi:catechol 2,3-dioxygenase-like lactoylglutathione lyase family enzyme